MSSRRSSPLVAVLNWFSGPSSFSLQKEEVTAPIIFVILAYSKRDPPWRYQGETFTAPASEDLKSSGPDPSVSSVVLSQFPPANPSILSIPALSSPRARC